MKSVKGKILLGMVATIVIGMVAVSYTHLDVYKRQERGCAAGLSYGSAGGFRETAGIGNGSCQLYLFFRG